MYSIFSRFLVGVSTRSVSYETLVSVDRQLMEINYFAPVILTKILLPTWIKETQVGKGTRKWIVVISSIQGLVAIPFRAAYAASKHAAHGFFGSLRSEVAQFGIQVSMICPGYIRTQLSRNAITANGSVHGQLDG